MTDLDLIIQSAKLGAAGSDNCNQVAAAIQRHAETHSVLIQRNRYLESNKEVQREALQRVRNSGPTDL